MDSSLDHQEVTSGRLGFSFAKWPQGGASQRSHLMSGEAARSRSRTREGVSHLEIPSWAQRKRRRLLKSCPRRALDGYELLPRRHLGQLSPSTLPTPSSPRAAKRRKGDPSVWSVTEAVHLATVGKEVRTEARGVAWAHWQGTGLGHSPGRPLKLARGADRGWEQEALPYNMV